MNDRVVDRAAAHATPAELAVRDWLLVGLARTRSRSSSPSPRSRQVSRWRCRSSRHSPAIRRPRITMSSRHGRVR